MSAWSMYTSTTESQQVQLGIFARHAVYYTYKKKWPSRDGNCDFKILRYCALVNCKTVLFSNLQHFTPIALIYSCKFCSCVCIYFDLLFNVVKWVCVQRKLHYVEDKWLIWALYLLTVQILKLRMKF